MRDKLLDVNEAGEIIGVSGRQVQRYCEKKLLPHQVKSGVYLIWESDAKAFKRPKPGPKSGDRSLQS